MGGGNPTLVHLYWYSVFYTAKFYSDVIYASWRPKSPQSWESLSKIHVKYHVSKQGFSNMAFDCLVAVLPANQMPGLKIFVQ